ncbi:MAG: fumarylacetoacetate hydrolase family protein [Nitrospinaceae bacterium]|jgi:2-keto-4-pentenoate hydratase/2-oxohepta-3-ene-1,7-dioic acid hydratase in catechol pathway|nr:fumarylacetoacetate hydrolase family protein [Nitrospinaceae bacterium]MBT3435241.1 fumarylacetoacetate hydrolase family protein [Nitrospinaceae bacterium]MBT3821814.1 fumarylacetoacetate hydrolase family protein [Nitrospinaceae bacterium]MBT4092563.1 fumarylacetoacetate hydrolase family protein [Nitrospinaceae bacterium]MBT4428880.1 fumarylacetoacetate hydrolase family protein [Nitrospinaceae bacterium]
MRWMRFEVDGKTTYGIVEGDSVKAVDGDPFDGYQETGKNHDISNVKILIPLVPKTFYAAGLNYVAHIEEQARLHGQEINLPKKADVGYRANNSLIAHGETIVIPKDATVKVEYEGELVVVIGKKAKNITENEALDYVLGFTIGNDLSERNWQKEDRTMWRAKNTDTFAPMGPWIDTDAKLEDMETIVSVNGKEKIRFKTNDMLFGVEHYMSTISKYIELLPGDVLWMGTEGDSPNLVHGDVVDIEITGIGTLSNPIIKES